MLRAPVLTMVLAATAIPVELRPLGQVTLDFGIHALDMVANIAGYVPVGIVLAGLGRLPAVLIAASMSAFAEASQFGMVHRVPSAVDFAANTIGAILGVIAGARWKIGAPGFGINRWRAMVAAILAFGLLRGIWTMSAGPFNARGATSPGTLEAHWKFDESSGRIALDSSGHGLHGRSNNALKRVAGVMGRAVLLDGVKDWIDVGPAPALRLAGSMTISAWIRSTSFPFDDAAIVSQLSERYNFYGYQLDTTIDTGPRTIGFKLTNACGGLMARYGATPLALNTWYHVAGVYDAEARTLDVYLNGELDDGSLAGTVTGTQHSSRSAVYVGRRSDLKGFEFAGFIEDVRIYSFALTKTDIAAVMRGSVSYEPAQHRIAGTGPESNRDTTSSRNLNAPCAVLSEHDDAKIPGAVATLGVLLAIACVGLWPSAGALFPLVGSGLAGLVLLPITPTLPSFNLWTIPLASLAGGASVAVSVRRKPARPPTTRG